MAAYFIWCARLLTHIFNIKEKKGGLCCQVKVVEIVILEMIPGRGLLLLFWDLFLIIVKHVKFKRQKSSEIFISSDEDNKGKNDLVMKSFLTSSDIRKKLRAFPQHVEISNWAKKSSAEYDYERFYVLEQNTFLIFFLRHD